MDLRKKNQRLVIPGRQPRAYQSTFTNGRRIPVTEVKRKKPEHSTHTFWSPAQGESTYRVPIISRWPGFTRVLAILLLSWSEHWSCTDSFVKMSASEWKRLGDVFLWCLWHLAFMTVYQSTNESLSEYLGRRMLAIMATVCMILFLSQQSHGQTGFHGIQALIRCKYHDE